MRSKHFLTSATGICLIVAAAARPMQTPGNNASLKDILTVQRHNADDPRVDSTAALQSQRNNAASLNEERRPIGMRKGGKVPSPQKKSYNGPATTKVGNVRIVFPFSQDLSNEELYRIYNLVLSHVDFYEQNPNRVTEENAGMVEAYRLLKTKFEDVEHFVDPLRGLRDMDEGSYHALRDLYMVREQYTHERANGFQSVNEGELRKKILKFERNLAMQDVVDTDDFMHLSEPMTLISNWIYPIPREPQQEKSREKGTEHLMKEELQQQEEEKERKRAGVRPEFTYVRSQRPARDVYPEEEYKAITPKTITPPTGEEEEEWAEYNPADYDNTPEYNEADYDKASKHHQEQDFYYNSQSSFDFNENLRDLASQASADDLDTILAKPRVKPAGYYHRDFDVPDPDDSNPGDVGSFDMDDDQDLKLTRAAREPQLHSGDLGSEVNDILLHFANKAKAAPRNFKKWNFNDMFSTPVKETQQHQQKQQLQPQRANGFEDLDVDELDNLLGTPAAGLTKPISPMPHKKLRPIGLIRSGHVDFTSPKGSRSAPVSMNDVGDDVPSSANVESGDIDQDSIELNNMRRTFNTLPRMVEEGYEEEEEYEQYEEEEEYGQDEDQEEAYEGDEEDEDAFDNRDRK